MNPLQRHRTHLRTLLNHLLAVLHLTQRQLNRLQKRSIHLSVGLGSRYDIKQLPRRHKVHHHGAKLINCADGVLPRLLSHLLQAALLLLEHDFFTVLVHVRRR